METVHHDNVDYCVATQLVDTELRMSWSVLQIVDNSPIENVQ